MTTLLTATSKGPKQSLFAEGLHAFIRRVCDIYGEGDKVFALSDSYINLCMLKVYKEV